MSIISSVIYPLCNKDQMMEDYDEGELFYHCHSCGYGHGFYEYELCGHSFFWVSRTDGKDLSSNEMEKLQKDITEDLRYDYPEDELGFWFDDSLFKDLLVYLYEVFDSMEENRDV